MSLREICYERVIEQMFGQTRQAIAAMTGPRRSEETAYCALITDDKTLRVLSSCSKVYDALDAGVAVVELISKSRQALPNLDAIYFLTPTNESAELLVKDFKLDKKPQYRNAFIFWSTSVAANPEVLKIIANANPILPRIKSVVDFNLHFVAYESRAFHLDMPNALFKLFPGENDTEKAATMREMTVRLSTACITLGERPKIRFHQSDRGLCETLATQLESYLKEAAPSGLSTSGDTELLIVDRSIDVSGLLVHEYTYQALCYDVLHIPCCTPMEVREKAGEDLPPDDTYQLLDSQEVQTVLLGEQDDLFVKYRHQHITTVSRKVAEELRHFSKENAAAQYAAARAAGGSNTSDRDIANAIRQLPQYKEMLLKFWAHLTLTDCCMKSLKEQGVFAGGTLEQDLATGVDKEGKAVQVMSCLSTLGKLVAEKSGVKTAERARLLLLYFINMLGVHEDERKKMINLAGLSLDSINAVHNFLNLGLHIQPDTMEGGKPAGTTVVHTHVLHSDSQRERYTFYKRKARESEYETDRYEPVVKDIMELAVANKLNNRFTYVSEPDRKGRVLTAYTEEGGRNGRVRATKFDWTWASGNEGEKAGKKGGKEKMADAIFSGGGQGRRKRLIVFVIGGMTFAEIRSAYDVSRSSGADVLIGSTSIVTPPNLLDALRKTKEELHGW